MRKHVSAGKFFCIFLSSALLVCCDSAQIYKQEIKVSNESWTYDEVLDFSWSIQDTSAVYQIDLAVEYLKNYSYQNLYVKCSTQYPDTVKFDQVVSLELNRASGHSNGTCSGSRCSVEIPLQSKAKFPIVGEYHLFISQHSRENPLQGIESFTMVVKKLANN
ncbi:MAG: gliding motility lipoprotein GldH [Bacteroidota bacterium]|nr:gliding motility lipoprotein GldH [Bacteroidota bacterium]